MSRHTILLAAAALLAACGQQSSSAISAEGVRAALPRPESVQVGAPGAASGAAAAGAPQYHSPYAAISYWTAVSLNTGVWWTLTTVRVVTLLPPTSCGGDTCTWGPAPGDDGLNVWTLQVARGADGYAWTLSAHPTAGGDEVALISGLAVPGSDPWHGSGTLSIDFDASAALAHPAGWTQTDFGRADIAYDDRTGSSIHATFLGARSQDPSDPCRMDAAYAFDATASGGELQLGFHNLDTAATLRLRTRWTSTGAGRGDALFVQGSTSASASQCWDGAPDYLMVFDGTAVTPGDESACAFAAPVPPTIEVP